MAISNRIINNLITFVNIQEPSITNNLLVGFDILDTNRNSLCFSLSDEDVKGDTFEDVTGQFYSNYIDLSLFFRDISGTEGFNDLTAYDFLNTLANYIKKNYNYKVINNELQEWVENIEITKQAKMIKVWDGNIKDYETRLRLHYVYQKR
jgi:hypothetical protein